MTWMPKPPSRLSNARSSRAATSTGPIVVTGPRPHGAASGPQTVRFTRQELSDILNVYGRMVAAGEWRDYAIDMGRETAYRVAEEWIETLPDRPALFPDVPDARGKKYAKTLEALTKRANLSSDLTRHAQSLVLRYELAARR